MKRTGFARKTIERKPQPLYAPVKRSGVIARIADAFTPVPKEILIRHEGYRRLVAAMPCKHCGIWNYSQCAHGNLDKGTGIKTDDRYSFALCTLHPGPNGQLVLGCHEQFDRGLLYSKFARRLIEAAWAADTRRAVQAAGCWPADLPLWSDE